MGGGGGQTMKIERYRNDQSSHTALYDLVATNSLYAWQHVCIANELESTGKKWYSYLSNQHSGTYNKQYMVINYAAFEIAESLPDEFVWQIKQISGTVAGLDVTDLDIVERWYWASYNVAAIEEMYNKSCYPESVPNSATDTKSSNYENDAIDNNESFENYQICVYLYIHGI